MSGTANDLYLFTQFTVYSSTSSMCGSLVSRPNARMFIHLASHQIFGLNSYERTHQNF